MTSPEFERPDLAPEQASSDRSLLRRLQGGQPDASTELYIRYAARLQALASAQSSVDLARRVEPEEIVQSVFRTFFRRASLGHYSVPDGEEIWKLLLVIALNKVRASAAFHRAAKRDVRKTVGGEVFDRVLSSESAPDDLALHNLRMVVSDLVDVLPASHRRMVEMRIEGYDLNEIADSVQRSKRSVERVLQDFRQRLASLIRDEDR